MILPLAPASKTTLQKTGIASNILEAISQENESQHTLEKCIAYSQPFGDYAQVNESQILMICRKIGSTSYWVHWVWNCDSYTTRGN